MKTSYKLLSWDYGKGVSGNCFWFRVLGYGLHFKKNDSMMLFSERYGYTPYKVILGIRVKVLKP